jgi:HPt (histidine-containing phosphotransfer) domain-containing protein
VKSNALILEELRSNYLTGLGKRIASMTDAFARRDYDAVRVSAHQLHGSGKSYGFPALSEAASALESACGDGDVTLIRAGLAALEAEITNVAANFAEGK